MTRKRKKKITRVNLHERLAVKYSGNDEWATFFEIPDVTGRASRYCDCLAINLWQSRGHVIHGHEIKHSRADWLKEKKQPAKAAAFFHKCNYWWLVISDTSIVQDGELPEGWGLMVPHGSGLRVAVKATRHDADPMTLPWMASILRQASRRPPLPEEKEIKQRIAGAYEEGRKSVIDDRQNDLVRVQNTLNDLQEKVRDFQKATGLRIGWGFSSRCAEVIEAVRNFPDMIQKMNLFEKRFGALASHLSQVQQQFQKREED